MTKAIIFDLDSCLAAADEVGEQLFAPAFAAIYIDAIDDPNRRGKHGFFQDILSAHGLRPDEVLVVGDNPDSELEAGTRLGWE